MNVDMKKDKTQKTDFCPADDCPPAHRFRGNAFFCLPKLFISARDDLTAYTFGSRTLQFVFSLFLVVILLISGCDQTFQPIHQGNTSPFSMFGYLDASADTQWVRVTPLRTQVGTLREKPNMRVTLQPLPNGEETVMQDSLQYFYLPSGYTAMNHSTTMNLSPGQSYRLRAERPDGAASSVTVTIPEDFPTPTTTPVDQEGCIVRLQISGVERLAEVQYQMKVRIRRTKLDIKRSYSVPYRNRMRETSPGEYEATVNIRSARRQILNQLRSLPANTEYEILKKYLFVASGGPEWIDREVIESLSDLEYALPGVVSNVENGTGYVIGVVSKTIPDNVCP